MILRGAMISFFDYPGTQEILADIEINVSYLNMNHRKQTSEVYLIDLIRKQCAWLNRFKSFSSVLAQKVKETYEVCSGKIKLLSTCWFQSLHRVFYAQVLRSYLRKVKEIKRNIRWFVWFLFHKKRNNETFQKQKPSKSWAISNRC